MQVIWVPVSKTFALRFLTSKASWFSFIALKLTVSLVWIYFEMGNENGTLIRRALHVPQPELGLPVLTMSMCYVIGDNEGDKVFLGSSICKQRMTDIGDIYFSVSNFDMWRRATHLVHVLPTCRMKVWNRHFVVFQPVKRGSTPLCDG